MMRLRSLSLAALIGAALMTSQARADMLSTLVEHNTANDPLGSITVGDKVFSQFDYTRNSGQSPLASDISVNAIPPNPPGTDAFGNFGIRFGLAGFNNPSTAPTDFLISYTVTSTGAKISDAHLNSNLAIAGTPGPNDNPFGQITEVLTATGVGTISKNNFQNFVNPTASQTSDATTFTGGATYQSIRVSSKDTFLRSTGSGATLTNVTVSNIDQSFSQVPEPGSLLLMGLGGVGMIGYAMRRRLAVV